MGGRGHAGFSLLEVLVALAVLGAGLGGLVRLVNVIVRGEAAVRERMGARLDALGALEQGGGLGKARWFTEGDRLEARAAWVEGEQTGEVRLGRWSGPLKP